MRLRFRLLLIILTALRAFAADVWDRRVNNGFGDDNNIGVEWLQAFNGKIYAAVGRDNINVFPAGNFVSIFQSSDLVNWTRVLGPLNGQTEVFAGCANASVIFFGTRSSTAPGQIWRSTEGTSWSQFNATGSGLTTTGNTTVTALGIFGTNLYAGFSNASGGQVWRRPLDGSANWTRVIDFADGTGLGGSAFAAVDVSPAYLYVSRGVLYLSTVNTTLATNSAAAPRAFLYQTTEGASWTRSTAVANGFGDSNNLSIASLVESGDFLYASTQNRVTGGQVWRTLATSAAANSSTAWQKVVGNGTTLRDGFGQTANNPDNREVHHLDVGLGFLWATTYSDFSTGAQVWRSSDGVTWIQSNQNGFVGGNIIRRGFPTVELFNNQIVWGGSGGSAFGVGAAGTIAQVWSTSATGIDGALNPPTLTTPPTNQTATVGGNVTFSAVATGSAPLTYSWWKNGNPIPGATSPTFTITNVQLADAGTYFIIAANPWGLAPSAPVTLTVNAAPPPPPPPAPTRIINLSVNTVVTSPGEDFTMGYVVSGDGTASAKPLVIRAVGPSLGTFGLTDAMADPKLELFAGETKTGENNNWGGDVIVGTAMVSVGAFPLASGGSLDAAVSTSIATRDNSVKVSSANNGTGRVLAEVYDATPNDSFSATTRRLINVSVRKQIGTGLTVGFVIRGSSDKRVLIRAVGPTLNTLFGLPDVIADPQLTLFGAGSVQLGANNDWVGADVAAAFNAVGAFALPNGSKDAVLLATLQPGDYSVEVKAVTGTATGEGLIEVYDLP